MCKPTADGVGGFYKVKTALQVKVDPIGAYTYTFRIFLNLTIDHFLHTLKRFESFSTSISVRVKLPSNLDKIFCKVSIIVIKIA